MNWWLFIPHWHRLGTPSPCARCGRHRMITGYDDSGYTIYMWKRLKEKK